MTSQDRYYLNHAETIKENVEFEGLAGDKGKQRDQQAQGEGNLRRLAIGLVTVGGFQLSRDVLACALSYAEGDGYGKQVIASDS